MEELDNLNFPDGYYRANFKIVPFELAGYNVTPLSDSALFVIDNAPLALGDVVNQGIGLNPHNLNLNKMRAGFSLSEGAYLTVSVLDKSDRTVAVVCDHAFHLPAVRASDPPPSNYVTQGRQNI